jgi:hypothetical protein
MFNSDELQRELDELEMASYLTRILPEFARTNATARKSRYESELERRATWLRKMPLDHPRRAEVEAERTTIEAELAALEVQPTDCSGISIDTAVYRPTQESTAEEPAEADRHSADLGTTGHSKGQPTGGNTAQETQGPKESHKGKKPLRRNEKYEGIDSALREFAKARPNSHQEVFRLLDDRKVAIPSRKPFKSAGGWWKGFQQNRHSATAWLSQVWGRLGLPPFPRGPKK